MVNKHIILITVPINLTHGYLRRNFHELLPLIPGLHILLKYKEKNAPETTHLEGKKKQIA